MSLDNKTYPKATCIEKSLRYVFGNLPLWGAAFRFSYGNTGISQVGRVLKYSTEHNDEFLENSNVALNSASNWVKTIPNSYPNGALNWLETNLPKLLPKDYYNIFLKYSRDAPKCSEPFEVYRGEKMFKFKRSKEGSLIPYDKISDLQKDDIFLVNGILSTSLDEEVAKTFGSWLIKINVPVFYPILMINPSEREIIILPGTQMKVIKNYNNIITLQIMGIVNWKET